MNTFFKAVSVFFLWMISGYFVLFAVNGGAGGSSVVSDVAWIGLGIYTLIFVFLHPFTRRLIQSLLSK